MSKAVQFDDYGGIEVLEVLEVLEVRDVPRPEPGPHQVLVAVRAAGLNISEAKIRTGLVREVFGIRPEGQARRERSVEIDQPCAPCLPLLAVPPLLGSLQKRSPKLVPARFIDRF